MHACMTVILFRQDISETVKDASSSAASLHLAMAVQSDFMWLVMQSKKVICTPFKDIPTLLTTPADVLKLVALLETYSIYVGNADIALSCSIFLMQRVKYAYVTV